MAGLKEGIGAYREQLLEEDWPEGDELPDAPVIGVVAKGLADLLDQMIRARGYDDRWLVAPERRYLGYGHYLSFRAEKVDAEYFFGFQLRSGFFLGTVLRYPEYLEAMPDSYWGRISGLAELGRTSYGPLLQLAALPAKKRVGRGRRIALFSGSFAMRRWGTRRLARDPCRVRRRSMCGCRSPPTR